MWFSSACANMGKNADVVNCVHGGFLWLSDEVGYDKYISWSEKMQQGFSGADLRGVNYAQNMNRYKITFI